MIEDIPAVADLEQGATYHRITLHEEYGGTQFRGIAPCKDHPYVFLFAGDAGEEHGYRDEFRGDTFIYTGEGQEGDMEMTGGNRAIRDHREDGRELHLFESNDEAWSITYVGEFEYDSWFTDRLRDTNGNEREAIRFRLEPVDDEVAIEADDLEALALETLYDRAKGNSVSESELEGATQMRYSRSEAVREYALRAAEGVCQGCGEPAPFTGRDGAPFLEVHHLHRRSDGGPDHPDNVVALCPNCHRRVHYGEDGKTFNRELIARTENQ
ncbi:HNH endonuclease [Natronobacterium texcoconense]|uniref:5-methylcytosine-specific restriction enzyme A n=1 Tax=Natronobacterium texcoconense TaxID=1095778 RepID=A0A1H1CE62_NATTX|nr:HNH endonuclease [Natronobacterium texcoconense]SDQ62485.1 5-methylcytosine-specific restriction enzyme A [Natronobacterium texcoconense]